MDAEAIQQLCIKLVRRARDSSTKKWHEDVERFTEKLWGEAAMDIVAITKVDHDLLVWTKGDRQRQKTFEVMKNLLGKASIEGGLVVLCRPAHKSALLRPCNVIYGEIRKAVQSKPQIRTIPPSASKRNWLVLSGEDIIASGTMLEHGAAIDIVIADQFICNGVKIAGGPIATLLELELMNTHAHYPFTTSITTAPKTTSTWFSPSSGSKGTAGKGKHTSTSAVGSASTSAARSPFDARGSGHGSREGGKGRGGHRR